MTEPTDIARAKALEGIPHGFLGRRGGVSVGIFASLDLGRRDTNPHFEENRRRAIHAVMPGASLRTLHQIHSADVVTIAPDFNQDRPKADAMVIDRPGILLGILTADCGPVLFADPAAQIVGAAHAGWKGALGGVTDATIEQMVQLGAKRENIIAAVGPCIARTSYEVDDGFALRFEEHDPANERFFSPGREGHQQFDMEGYIVNRLARAGIKKIEALGLDTYSDAERYFSYRRTTHLHEPDYGRQISLIGISGA